MFFFEMLFETSNAVELIYVFFAVVSEAFDLHELCERKR